jgi:hypothetical protein
LSQKIAMRSKNLAALLVSIFPAVYLLAALLAVSGCGKGGPKSASGTKVFESASPEIKAEWEKIATADTANDYVTVIQSTRKLLPQITLTPEQRSALVDTMTAANIRMMDAAQKGDVAAQQAVADVRKGWR